QQSARGVGEVPFDFELEVAFELAFQRKPSSPDEKSIRRVVARLIAAIIELAVAGKKSFKRAIAASEKRMIVVPTGYHLWLVLNSGLLCGSGVRSSGCCRERCRAKVSRYDCRTLCGRLGYCRCRCAVQLIEPLHHFNERALLLLDQRLKLFNLCFQLIHLG